MPQLMLQIEGLTKRFGQQKVLDGVDLAVPAGTVTTVVGKSGAGKSVLLKCVAGLIDPNAGRVLVAGGEAGGIDRRTGRRRVSYMFQHNALFDYMTAAENVALPLIESSSLPRPEIFRRAVDLLGRLEVGDAAGRYPAELSGGMQKRVALARTLITQPDVVLFDEPTAGLDPARKNAVLEMIERNRRNFGFTAVIVSHDLPETLYISDHVAVLEAGRIVHHSTPWGLEAADNRGGTFLTRSEDHLRSELMGAATWTDFLSDISRAPASHVLALTLRRQTSLATADRFASFEVMRAILGILRVQPWVKGRLYAPDARSCLATVDAPGDRDALLGAFRAAAAAAGIAASGAEEKLAPFTVEVALHPLSQIAASRQRGAREVLAGSVHLFAAHIPAAPAS